MSNVISLAFALGEAAPQRQAPDTDIFQHDTLRPFGSTLDPMARRIAGEAVRRAFRDGETVAALTRRLTGQGLDRRAAQGLARTGLSVLAHAQEGWA